MQADHWKSEVNTLAERLVSLDPVEFNSAINQYFDVDAKFDSRTLKLSGATTLKNWTQLQSSLATESHVVGEPTYNEATQTIDFAWSRTYQVPRLPTYVPFAQQISGASKTLHYQLLLHLDGDGPSQIGSPERKLLVTRAEVILREKPIGGSLIPYYLLKPVASVGAGVVSIAAGFFTRHPPTKEGIVALVGHAIDESVSAAYSGVFTAKAKTEARAQRVRDGLPPLTIESAQDLERQLEERAKAAGIPVDQYKAQLNDAAQKAENATYKAAHDAKIKAKGMTDSAIDTAFDVAGGVVVVTNDAKDTAVSVVNVAVGTTYGIANRAVNTTVNAATGVKDAAFIAVGTVLNTAEDIVKFLSGKKQQAHEQGQQLKKYVENTGVPVNSDEMEKILIERAQQVQAVAANTANYAGQKTNEALGVASDVASGVQQRAGQAIGTAQDAVKGVQQTAYDAAGRAQGAVKGVQQTAYDAAGRVQDIGQDLLSEAKDTAQAAKQFAEDKAEEARAMAEDKANEAQRYAQDQADKAKGMARDYEAGGMNGEGTSSTVVVQGVEAIIIPVTNVDGIAPDQLGEPIAAVIETDVHVEGHHNY